MHVLASLLRSVKTSQPATRRQRRPGGRPGGRKGEGCKRKRQEARQDKCHTKLSPSAEEFRSTPPPTSLQFFYNKPMKSYPYCPPLPSGPEPTGPFKIVSYSSVDNGATAVGGTDDGAEGKDERGSESDYESCTEGEESSADGADAAARAAVVAPAAAVAAEVAASSALQVAELELMKLPGAASLLKEACAAVQRNADSKIEEIFTRVTPGIVASLTSLRLRVTSTMDPSCGERVG